MYGVDVAELDGDVLGQVVGAASLVLGLFRALPRLGRPHIVVVCPGLVPWAILGSIPASAAALDTQTQHHGYSLL